MLMGAPAEMTLLLLAYLGGVLTIISPCILPVLPFVFARSDRPFASSGLPMLIGMAAMFAVVATLAAVSGGWAVQANEYGRYVAIALLALFGATLLFPALSDHLTRPLAAPGRPPFPKPPTSRTKLAGARAVVARAWRRDGPSMGALCRAGARADPNGRGPQRGERADLAAAGDLCRRRGNVAGPSPSDRRPCLQAAMKRSLGAGEWIRRGLGVAVLVAVVVIALGLDTRFLTQVSLASTAPLEQGMVDELGPNPPADDRTVAMTGDAPGNPAATGGSCGTGKGGAHRRDDWVPRLLPRRCHQRWPMRHLALPSKARRYRPFPVQFSGSTHRR